MVWLQHENWSSAVIVVRCCRRGDVQRTFRGQIPRCVRCHFCDVKWQSFASMSQLLLCRLFLSVWLMPCGWRGVARSLALRRVAMFYRLERYIQIQIEWPQRRMNTLPMSTRNIEHLSVSLFYVRDPIGFLAKFYFRSSIVFRGPFGDSLSSRYTPYYIHLYSPESW